MTTTTDLRAAYAKERAPHVSPYGVHMERASHALRSARTRIEWEEAGGYDALSWEIERTEQDDDDSPAVRLVIKPDQDTDAACDMDAPERIIAEVRERANRDGVWGVCAEFWDGGAWVEVDSVWGFIGDDWRGSGYDVDLMRSALDARAEHLAAGARAMEAARPDLYA